MRERTNGKNSWYWGRTFRRPSRPHTGQWSHELDSSAFDLGVIPLVPKLKTGGKEGRIFNRQKN